MALSNDKKELIALEVIRTLKSQFSKFPQDVSGNRNAPFQEGFLKAFENKLEGKVKNIDVLISLSSWSHGLSTSLGQSFFEKTSYILKDAIKREFKKQKITQNQKNIVSQIITDLSNGTQQPNLLREDKLIIKESPPYNTTATDFTVDVFFEDTTEILAIELKTVKPNKGTFEGEKRKILEAKALLRNLYPNKKVSYYLGFPFDPTSDKDTTFDKKRFMQNSVKFETFIDPDEILLASELWDFLSGTKNTMEDILEIISKISTTQFLDKFELINNPKNLNQKESDVLEVLKSWFLFREIRVIENLPKLKKEKKVLRELKKSIFNSSFKYNENRLKKLSEFF